MYCLLILTILAVYHDIKSYKIKNYIIITGYISGLAINIRRVGLLNIYAYLLALVLPLLILFPLFLIKALGAGDIKFFSVVGSYLGVYAVLKIIVISFFIGGVISIIYLIRTKSFLGRINHLTSYIFKVKELNKYMVNTREISVKNIKIPAYYNKEEHGREGIIHFSVAIFLALIFYIFINT